MKRGLALCLVFSIMLALCACTGTNNIPDETEHIPSETEIKNVEMVEIINNDGETENLSGAELLSINDSNEVKFKNKYHGAAVTVISEVEKVHGAHIISGHEVEAYIELKGGWLVEAASESDVAELSAGDIVKITGNIHHAFGFTIFVYIWNEDTTTIELYTE